MADYEVLLNLGALDGAVGSEVVAVGALEHIHRTLVTAHETPQFAEVGIAVRGV